MKPSYSANGILKWCSHLGKQTGSSFRRFLEGLNMEFPCGPFTSQVYTHDNWNVFSCKNLYTNVHSIFPNTMSPKKGKLPTYPSTDELTRCNIVISWNIIWLWRILHEASGHSEMMLPKKCTYRLKDLQMKSYDIYNLLSNCTVMIITVNI